MHNRIKVSFAIAILSLSVGLFPYPSHHHTQALAEEENQGVESNSYDTANNQPNDQSQSDGALATDSGQDALVDTTPVVNVNLKQNNTPKNESTGSPSEADADPTSARSSESLSSSSETYEFEGLEVRQTSDAGPWEIEAIFSGNTTGLQYKFVWERDGWADWGVIQGLSNSPTATWAPGREGQYTVCCDVRDSSGKTITYTRGVSVGRAWDISPDLGSRSIELGETVLVSAGASGEGVGELAYNYVWSRNGSWDEGEWDSTVNQTGSRTGSGTWEFKPSRAGRYTIYVNAADRAGISHERSLTLTVSETYEFEGLNFSEGERLQIDSPTSGTIDFSGNTVGLQYKLVWEKDNWDNWGIIKEMSSDNVFEWDPQISGDVTFHIDVKDSTGKIHSIAVKDSIADEELIFSGILVSPSSNLSVGDSITITPLYTASTSKYLRFKYVWSRDNWESWGVLSFPSTASSCSFDLSFSGDIEFYVDIVDSTGNTVTRSTPVHIESEEWKFSGVSVSSDLCTVGDTVDIAAETTGESSYLTYKFVWEKDNWDSWGVISKSSSPQITWKPSAPGDYTIYCDITDSAGAVQTKTAPVSFWSFLGVKATSADGGRSWTVRADLGVSGATVSKLGFTYKFVWTTPSWSNWGVLSKGTSNSATFNPASMGLPAGTYGLYVDLIDGDDNSVTKSTTVNFSVDQSQMTSRIWYKSSSTGWLIAVNTSTCRVGIYQGSYGNWQLKYYWACSPGKASTPTVVGDFTVQNKGYVFGSGYSCYYWTQFYGDYLFHSVLYNPGTFQIQDGRLGQNLSHGCVRLALENAKWIYDNIPRGTKVVVYR
ncbi:L,D-transpeptidase family protein [Thermophilibacter sp.]|uniref:L,D-transpeptidase family protein n=1 Tax=Thermophilibacter sp. TaxID=2847309 RepID=UPI003A954719